jgi:hypothetical protein
MRRSRKNYLWVEIPTAEDDEVLFPPADEELARLGMSEKSWREHE